MASLDDYMKCRLNSEEIYFNSRYREQIDCLREKYVEYKNGETNQVLYF